MKEIMVEMDETETDALPQMESDLCVAANQLRHALDCETALARSGALDALERAVEDKRVAHAAFLETLQNARYDAEECWEAETTVLQQLTAAAEANALILEAVLTTATDLSDRLRTALTSGADPGTYGPKGKGPRHALAARYDTRI